LLFPLNKPLSFAFKSDSAFGAGRREHVSKDNKGNANHAK
jgi:hypothetical protein